MSLKSIVESDMKKAMLEKNKDDLRALRAIKSLIMLAETEKGGQDGLDEATELKLLTKAAKQRKESAELYQEQGRDDLAATELAELEIINRYLPEQMSEDDLKAALQKIIESTGADGPADMGRVMGAAMKELSGKADGKLISEMVRQLLI